MPILRKSKASVLSPRRLGADVCYRSTSFTFGIQCLGAEKGKIVGVYLLMPVSAGSSDGWRLSLRNSLFCLELMTSSKATHINYVDDQGNHLWGGILLDFRVEYPGNS